MNVWESDFDPLTMLLQCENNIQQCAVAINQGTEVMKELAAKYNHQQEVIEQLQFNNRRLTDLTHELIEQVQQLKKQQVKS